MVKLRRGGEGRGDEARRKHKIENLSYKSKLNKKEHLHSLPGLVKYGMEATFHTPRTYHVVECAAPKIRLNLVCLYLVTISRMACSTTKALSILVRRNIPGKGKRILFLTVTNI
ncbi:hypothetical protein CEXT_61601 [Caerostris extrusa]|uniref:Uncharacterized protein n=1 Tax=Caerostris extrusa TaxID=172846 RepID=A0AAV4XFW3_CAEEX|nr:hypothetical protein CEXT_61601 [Caerostris extrusa]